MSMVLQLSMKNMEGALERLLGVVRYRGFQVMGMNAQTNREGSHLDVRLTVSGTKSSNLCKQIAKLFDVENVSVFSDVRNVKIS